MVTSLKRLGPEKDYTGGVVSIYKRQTCPLIRAHKKKAVTVKD
jgi:hypothetical protein